MPFLPLKSLAAGLCAAALCTVALANKDVSQKPPTPPQVAAVDKSPRCLPASVNTCRSSCERQKFDTTDRNQLARKNEACKQDCIRGC